MEYDSRRGWKLLAVLLLLVAVVALGWLAPRWQEGINRRIAPEREILVYYATADAMGLMGLPVSVPAERVTAEGVLEELFSGPRNLDGYHNPIPVGGRVQWIQVSGDLATVSLNQELVDNHPGGSAGELLTIYSIVETLTQLPEIERVQLLVEGRRVETLVGHMAVDLPLEPDPGMVLGRADRLETGTAPIEAP